MKRFLVLFAILSPLALTACDRFNPPAASPTIVVTPPADAAAPAPVVVQVPVAVPGPPGPQGDRGDTGRQGNAGAQGQQGDQGDQGKRGHTGDSGDTVILVPAEKKHD
jgi:hypothetical protein